MKIIPVNNVNQNFKSKIKTNAFFNAGIKLSEKDVNSSELKRLNFVQNFYEALNQIRADKSAESVEFVYDSESQKAMAIADGEVKSVYNSLNSKIQQGYVLTEIVKQYANTLGAISKDAILENCKSNIQQCESALQQAKQEYMDKLTQFISNIKF